MPWFSHPSVAPIVRTLLGRLREGSFRFRRLKRIVLLCGSATSDRRATIAEYFRRWHPTVSTFYADEVWRQIAATTKYDALQMTEQLAAYADVVVVLVESPGTFAELGAFSVSRQLRGKLLPILDRTYETSESFLVSGPVRWVNKASRFRPAIWTDFSSIASCFREIDDRVGRVSIRPERIEGIPSSAKHLLFITCDLVALLGPITAARVSESLQVIFERRPTHDVSGLLSLGVSLGLLGSVEELGLRFYFSALPTGGDLKPFARKRYFDISTERARFVGSLERISEAQVALASMRRRLNAP